MHVHECMFKYMSKHVCIYVCMNVYMDIYAYMSMCVRVWGLCVCIFKGKVSNIGLCSCGNLLLFKHCERLSSGTSL